MTCDKSVQLLSTQTDWVGWNQTNLTALCTSDCYSSLQNLATTAESACGDYIAPFNGHGLSATEMVDFYLYKYNLTCLADGSTFCLMQERMWDISKMDTVTWPTFTNKTYPDWQCKALAHDQDRIDFVIVDPVNGSPNVNESNGKIIPRLGSKRYPPR